MKRSRRNRNVKIVIIVAVCLAFVVGIGAGVGAGKYFLDKKGKTESTKSGDASKNGSDSIKGGTASKENGSQNDQDIDNLQGEKGDSQDQADSSKTDDSKDDSSSKDSADSKDKDDSQNAPAQGSDKNNQSGNQGSEDTYDASVPEDDPAVHRYEYIISDCTWQEAFQDCLNRGGYLVRINSSKEYEAVRKEISRQKLTDIYFRIGGRRDSQSKDYYWVNEENKLFGEKLNSDDSWCSGEWMEHEPSFQDGNLEEKYLDLFFYDGEKRFVWNDVPDDMLQAEPAYSGKLGYICEYED